MTLPAYDAWKLACPDDGPPDPDRALTVDGIVILDAECVDGRWLYLVADENGGDPVWLSEEAALA